MKFPSIASTLACGVALSAAAGGTAVAADGLVTLRSPHATAATLDRFEDLAKKRGLKVFARIDHAAGAKSIDKSLRPTAVLIFGNPQGGTPLMVCAQTIGIDLPLKALVWEDDKGQSWLSYNDPVWLAARHGAPDCAAAKAVGKAVADLSAEAVAP